MKLFFNRHKTGIFSVILIVLAVMFYIMRDGQTVRMVLIFGVLYFALSKVIIKITGSKISAEIRHAAEQNHVSILVTNKGKLPILSCQTEIQAKNLITGRTDNERWTAAIGPGKTRKIDLEIKDELCGGIHVLLQNITLTDFTGLIKKNVPAEAEEYVYIMPQLDQLTISQEEINKYDMESYKYSPVKKGNDSSETFGINVYRPGDSIKSIHWKLSGKMDDIIIRELGLPIDNKLMVIVDKAINGVANFDGKKRSEATQLAVSLSYTFMKMNLPHHIGWFNTRKGHFEVFNVTDEDSIWAYMSDLLTSPYDEKLPSAAAQFIEADTEKDFSSIALISNHEVDIERLMQYGEVNTYRPENFK